ncbi:beta-D-glucosyl crocetin beta-1,6-glucosyltransferase-like [Actinidia eriantha]|uniref:beta-D-glucosyl crocetin beta-1,6-glucosyltransferase-like n=1 Tax=Actinidia eriantha TaxID=165200 RepID=UPI00258587FA|nr:beta-D-glucosyl crocetin beta-1,6-glucosyltransferase-like [Actinidia eriantha]
MDAEQSTSSVLMFLWLGHGHISPFLELAKKLSTRNFKIYLCSTPINLNGVKPKLTQKYTHSIELVELHIPALPDLPPQYHTSKNLHPNLIPILKQALDLSEPIFSDILKTLKPDLLIYNFLPPWAPVVALSCFIWEDDDGGIIEWLKKKEKGSTVFVSFGTEYFLSQHEMEEIALGLELSGVNFIWVLRFPMGSNTSVERALPLGFLERVGERALVVEGWAPQVKILRHPSVGGFVSHCGWGLTMEAMKYGTPIIAIPIQYDQPANARLVEEIGVGVEVVRDSNGKFDRVKLGDVIKNVIQFDGEGTVRKKARELGETLSMKGEEDVDVLEEEL